MSIINISNTSSTFEINKNENVQKDQMALFVSEINEINKSNEFGWSPLYRTIIASNNDATVELLRMGADPNKPNSMGETPLYQAVEMENLIQVKTLLDYSADPNYPKNNGNTPLHYAVKKGNTDLVNELLSHGSDPNIQNKLFKQTPLHLIVKNDTTDNRFAISKLLLEYNASVNIKDKYDMSALEYAHDDGLLYNLMKEYVNVKESYDNQNNISIISKGELYIENSRQPSLNNSNNDDCNYQQPTHSLPIKLKQEGEIKGINQCKTKQINELSNNNDSDKEVGPSRPSEISDINPIDFINPLITNTNGSNIFSELQENNIGSVSERKPSSKSNTTDVNFADRIIPLDKCNINSLDNMSYSKSKSIIISELPLQLTSTKKKIESENSISNFTIKKLKCEEKDNACRDSLEDSNYKKRMKHKIKGSSLNIINLEMKFNDEKEFADSNKQKDREESLEKNTNVSNVNTQDLSQNCNIFNYNNNSSIYNNNTANSHSNKTGSAIYSVNSTRPQTQTNNKQQQQQQHQQPLQHHIPSNRNERIIDASLDNENDNKNEEINPRYAYLDKTQVINDTILSTKPNSSPIHLNQSKQLHKWLCSIDLLCYYNKILKSSFFNASSFSNGVIKSHSHLTYSNIEDIGIKKPGHIFRILLKLRSDSMQLNQSVVHFLLPYKMIGDALLSQSYTESFVIKDSCCGCIFKENKMSKLLDLETWLKFKGLIHMKDHFIHNGFESIEYVLLQMFSEYQFTEDSFLNYFHMYNAIDRKVLLKELLLQKKKICHILSLKFNDLEYDDTETNCKSCIVF